MRKMIVLDRYDSICRPDIELADIDDAKAVLKERGDDYDKCRIYLASGMMVAEAYREDLFGTMIVSDNHWTTPGNVGIIRDLFEWAEVNKPAAEALQVGTLHKVSQRIARMDTPELMILRRLTLSDIASYADYYMTSEMEYYECVMPSGFITVETGWRLYSCEHYKETERWYRKWGQFRGDVK